MKKWPWIVALLYVLLLWVLHLPLGSLSFQTSLTESGREFLKLLREWQGWLILVVLFFAQLALLRVPVAVASRRPELQRPLWSTVLAAAFMMGLLLFGAGCALCETITQLEKSRGYWLGFWLTTTLGLGSWAAWAAYFYRITRISPPELGMRRLQRYLWTGSILELLVAIPTHIVARNRDYCCAGMLTFVGLTCGVSVMLFAFGPAVYFLFVERWRRLHPGAASGGTQPD